MNVGCLSKRNQILNHILIFNWKKKNIKIIFPVDLWNAMDYRMFFFVVFVVINKDCTWSFLKINTHTPRDYEIFIWINVYLCINLKQSQSIKIEKKRHEFQQRIPLENKILNTGLYLLYLFNFFYLITKLLHTIPRFLICGVCECLCVCMNVLCRLNK